ncbi:Type III secretion system chaperone [Sulfidibacter corallicola]|uniref:Type III secretion system chaperone n=1 Tax=Sulfidibacter corallicola TaxID=2818388 RepID=A0A8A4THZ4_SULCO|nr:CesT family type III secretion system chaperone [Sulfidibacter corallicola]QTD48814.1 type III secretion system chaperone [Sulfidibacter corallicola]
MQHYTDKVNQWLSQIGEEVIGGLYLDPEGNCSFTTEDDLDLDLDLLPDGDSLYVSIPLIPASGEFPERMLEFALTLNLFQDDMKGGAISLDPQSGELQYGNAIELENQDFESFDTLLTEFGRIANQLKMQLQLHALDDTPAPDGSNAFDADGTAYAETTGQDPDPQPWEIPSPEPGRLVNIMHFA